MGKLGLVLVGGGSGFIGSHLCKLLKETGFDVNIISRTTKKGALTWDGIKAIGIPKETTAIVNLAGQSIGDLKYRWNDSFKKLVWDSRIDTSHLLANCITEKQAEVGTFVTISGVGIYDASNTETIYTEESPVSNFDFLSKMCIELELASKIPAGEKCRHVIIRCGVVLGRDGGMIKQLYLPFYLGLGGPVMPGHQSLPWIHVDDLCRFIMFSIQDNKINGVFNGVAPQIISNNEFTKAFGKALCRPTIIPVPETVIQILLQDRAKMLTTGPKVIPKRVLESRFDYNFPNIEAACKDVVAKK